MGVDELKCVTFSGTGYAGKVGQNVTQDTDWPDGEPLANYTRTINYGARSSVLRAPFSSARLAPSLHFSPPDGRSTR